MKKQFASVVIESNICKKTINIDITICAGLMEQFEFINEIIEANGFLKIGDSIKSIYFYEEEEIFR